MFRTTQVVAASTWNLSPFGILLRCMYQQEAGVAHAVSMQVGRRWTRTIPISAARHINHAHLCVWPAVPPSTLWSTVPLSLRECKPRVEPGTTVKVPLSVVKKTWLTPPVSTPSFGVASVLYLVHGVAGLFTGHDPARGSGQDFHVFPHGSNRVGSGPVRSGFF